MAPMAYRIALGSVLLNQPQDFRRGIGKVQNNFRKRLKAMEAGLFTEQAYAVATKQAIAAVQNFWDQTVEKLTPDELALIENMTQVYRLQYNAIEDPSSLDHGSAQKFIKVIDKNCPSYTNQAKARYLNPAEKTPTHDRFSSSMVYDDLNRSEKPLIVYASSCTDETAFHFLSTAQDITFGHMMDYAATMPPVYFGKGVKAPKEVSMYEPRAVWLESMIDKMAIITGRREKGTHFLEDEIKTNLELYALLKTKGETGKYMNRSIFDTVNYSPDFYALAEQNLLEISRKPLIEKHADYQLPFFA